MFAIMIENEEGEYVEYTDSTSWPTDMVFNSDMSNCINNNGETLIDAVTFSNGTATVYVGETMFCYLYFDIATSFADYLISTSADSGGTDTTLILHEEGCDNGCAEDGHYRYSGASDDVNNYICFGTSDLDTCLSNTDTYLFRIIEINPEDGAVKIIKSSVLVGNSSYLSWYEDDDEYYDFEFFFNYFEDELSLGYSYPEYNYNGYYNYWAVESNWYDNGEIYSLLAFDLNTTYLETFASEWQDLILWYYWNVGGISESVYYDDTTTAKDWYNAATSETAYFQIGLISVSESAYMEDSEYWSIGSTVSRSTTKWINTDKWINTEVISTMIYWTITRISDNNWGIIGLTTADNIMVLFAPDSTIGVFPSFYISSDATYMSGTGTSDSPYIITY